MKILKKESDLRGGYDKYPNAKSLYFDVHGIVPVRPAKNKDLFVIDKYNNVISLPRNSQTKLINGPFKEIPMKKLYRGGGKTKKRKYQWAGIAGALARQNAANAGSTAGRKTKSAYNYLQMSPEEQFEFDYIHNIGDLNESTIPDTTNVQDIDPKAAAFAKAAIAADPKNPMPILHDMHTAYNTNRDGNLQRSKWLNPITGTFAFNTLGNLANIIYNARRKNPYNRQFNPANNRFNDKIRRLLGPQQYLNYINSQSTLSPTIAALQNRGLPTSQYTSAINRANVDRLNLLSKGYLDAQQQYANALSTTGAEEAANINKAKMFRLDEIARREAYNLQKARDMFAGVRQIGQGASDAITAGNQINQQALALAHIAASNPQAVNTFKQFFTPNIFQGYWGNYPSRTQLHR